MSKKYKNIDDLFRAKLGGGQVKVPDSIKKGIDKKLDFGRRRGLLWLIPLFLAIGLITAYQAYLLSNDNTTELSSNEAIDLVDVNDVKEDIEIITIENEEINTTDNEIFHETEQILNINNKVNISNNNSNDHEVSGSTPDGKMIIDQQTGNPAEYGNDNDVPDDELVDNPDMNEEVNTGEPNNDSPAIEPKENIPSEEITENNPSSNDDIDDLLDEEISTENEIFIDENDEKISTEEDKTDAPIENEIPINKIESDTNLVEKEIVDSTNNTQENDEITDQVDENEGIVKPEEKYNPWFFSAHFGTDLQNTKYGSLNSSNIEELTNYATGNTDKLSFETTIEGKYILKNGLAFGTGIGYSKLSERYDYYKETILVDTTITWVYQYDSLDTTGTWPPIDSTGTESYTNTPTTLIDASGATQASYLHIPLSYGIHFHWNKIRFELFGMGRFNYLINLSGNYIENGSLQQYSKTNLGYYKKISFDILLGTNIHFNIFRNIYLSGTFRYRPGFNQFDKAANISKTNGYLQLGLGLSLKL